MVEADLKGQGQTSWISQIGTGDSGNCHDLVKGWPVAYPKGFVGRIPLLLSQAVSISKISRYLGNSFYKLTPVFIAL